MPKKAHGLGRGLDALLPDLEDMNQPVSVTGETQGENHPSVQLLPISLIDPNVNQPRKSFSEESIAQLAQSIQDQGILQPVLVSPVAGRYQIVAGERRYRAARAAGLTELPCIVREMDEGTKLEIALIENIQREDLNSMEVAQGIRALMDRCSYTQEEVARRLAKSRPTVANLLRLLTLPEEISELVRQDVLSAGHARVLAGIDDEKAQIALARETVEKGYSVRQLEKLAASRRTGQTEDPAQKPKGRELSVELSELEGRIRETLGVKATLRGSEQKGRIVLEYYSRDELEQFSDLLMKVQEMDGNV